MSAQGQLQYLPCSGNGKCVTLRQLNANPDYVNYFTATAYTGWDADRIHGCMCDAGWTGPACEFRTCPKGDDPNTPGVNEVQTIDCACTTTCAGGLTLTVGNQQTAVIPYYATQSLVVAALEALPNVEAVEVSFAQGTQLCSAAGTVTVVTFLLPQGWQPGMQVTASGGLVATVAAHYHGAPSALNASVASVTGTREHVECSGRGLCNNATGTCTCFAGFAASNGLGMPGTRADCGHRLSGVSVVNMINATYTVTSPCPVVNGAVCAGNGTCNTVTGVCTCAAGYGGYACEARTCLTTRTWFGSLGPTGHVGSPSVCGGVGYCNAGTGTCYACGGNWGHFQGNLCESFSCYGSLPSEAGGQVCSGHGACLTLRELAALAYNDYKQLSGAVYDTPWDADMIRGCACARALSVDNQVRHDATRCAHVVCKHMPRPVH
jgi:hypothetical protein